LITAFVIFIQKMLFVLFQTYSIVYVIIMVTTFLLSLSASILVLTIICWFPDMLTNSKHACQVRLSVQLDDQLCKLRGMLNSLASL